ncbi:hypothetical protein TNCV_2444151 [Trichonephila clavipes]|nr:hypothetical protein TNCV_2444151 [Trichonephila clavipes]
MIEELHRPLKSAIKCHASERWTEVLPIILLVRSTSSLKEDILCTPAELVFGTTIDQALVVGDVLTLPSQTMML